MMKPVAKLTCCFAVYWLLHVICAPTCFSQSDANKPQRMKTAHLPNAVKVHPKVISGGTPGGQAGFEELATLGVKTVISVDGLKPDVESAKASGLRYVHLPHGYDGIPPDRIRELAKAVHELPGPVYIHCHHGKHRSPAAAISACISLGLLPKESGESVMRLAGASQRYAGLYKSVENSKRLSIETLKAIQVEYRETADLPQIVEIMTKIDAIADRLEQHQARKWDATKLSAKLRPAHDALLLEELFSELVRDPAMKKRGQGFFPLLVDSHATATRLRKTLELGQDLENATRSFTRIRSSCAACHTKFRNLKSR